MRRADNSSRGVLPSVVCVSVIVKPRKRGGPERLRTVAPWDGEDLGNDDVEFALIYLCFIYFDVLY